MQNYTFNQNLNGNLILNQPTVPTIKDSYKVSNQFHGMELDKKEQFDPIKGNFVQSEGLPTFIEGRLEPRMRSNPLKSSLKLTKTEAELIIKNCQSNEQVHAVHLYRMTMTSGRNGKKQLSRFLIARTKKVDNANANNPKDRKGQDPYGKEPDWDKEQFPVPLVGHIIRKNEVVIDHLLIMNDLTINQTELVILNAPQFVLQSCCFLDASRRIKPIKDLSIALKVLLLKKIQFYNNQMRIQAMTDDQRMMLRNQIQMANRMNNTIEPKINGVMVQAPQFQIDMFTKESFENVMEESTGNSIIGRIGLCRDQNNLTITGIEVGGTIDDLIIKNTFGNVAQPLSNTEWYTNNGRNSVDVPDIKVGDIKWGKRESEFEGYGVYNKMVKPIWFKEDDVSSLFNNLSLDDVEALIAANEVNDKKSIVESLTKSTPSFNAKDQNGQIMINHLYDMHVNNVYNQMSLLIANTLKGIGNYDKDKKVMIPAAKFFTSEKGFDAKSFEDEVAEIVQDDSTLDKEMKIKGTVISAEELIHIWESINVLHRTANIRVRSFKV